MTGPPRSGVAGWASVWRTRRARARSAPRTGHLGRLERWINARVEKLDWMRLPPGVGVALSTAIILGSVAFGTVRGGHVPAVLDQLRDIRDRFANTTGFAIASVTIAGHKHLSREEILAIAGITGRTSLLFLDVADTRARLKTNAWIADATVEKLYPDRLRIALKERQAFALWQKAGRVGVIADDGTVLEPYLPRRFSHLPLFVGEGADIRAKDFLGLIDRYPSVRAQLHASVLVAERRWNLRLKNGVDVRLPESDADRALERLVALDRDKNLFARDITSIDLRLPDRIVVRLSDAAAQAREEALKAKKAKAKGGSA